MKNDDDDFILPRVAYMHEQRSFGVLFFSDLQQQQQLFPSNFLFGHQATGTVFLVGQCDSRRHYRYTYEVPCYTNKALGELHYNRNSPNPSNDILLFCWVPALCSAADFSHDVLLPWLAHAGSQQHTSAIGKDDDDDDDDEDSKKSSITA